LLGALCACATTPAAPRSEAPSAGWRIVERIGVARYLPPGAATWMPATIGEILADGSDVATGRGGRLIVDAPRSHISVGPGSRFVLPDGNADDRLNQQAGWLRYRIAQAAQPFRIYTRSLELEVRTGVVDVQVDQHATEVTVQEGQVRVATPDGLRQTQMVAGESARAGGSDDVQLAVRTAPGAALQPVEPVIVPALQPAAPSSAAPPKSTPAGAPNAAAAAPASTGTATKQPPAGVSRQTPSAADQAGATQEVRPRATAGVATQPAGLLPAKAPDPRQRQPVPAPQAADQKPGAAATQPDEADEMPAAERQTPRVEHSPESDAAAIRRAQFDRLTAGMLDPVEAPHPVPLRPQGVVR
jgi:hypothetical protein